MSEDLIWMIYNIIREIEYSFRTLKTDLDLRPIYHKKDDATMAHLNLGLLAYWVVNTVRYQLKKTENASDKKQETAKDQAETMPILFQWKEIIRIMNTQKSVLTVSQNRYDEVIISRRCSDPTTGAEAIYRRLKYKSTPFTKRKFVVHLCRENVWNKLNTQADKYMGGGLPQSPYRRRLQTGVCCLQGKPVSSERYIKRQYQLSGGNIRDDREETIDEASKTNQKMTKPEIVYVFGIRVGATCLLPACHPVYRWHDLYSGYLSETREHNL